MREADAETPDVKASALHLVLSERPNRLYPRSPTSAYLYAPVSIIRLVLEDSFSYAEAGMPFPNHQAIEKMLF